MKYGLYDDFELIRVLREDSFTQFSNNWHGIIEARNLSEVQRRTGKRPLPLEGMEARTCRPNHVPPVDYDPYLRH